MRTGKEISDEPLGTLSLAFSEWTLLEWECKHTYTHILGPFTVTRKGSGGKEAARKDSGNGELLETFPAATPLPEPFSTARTFQCGGERLCQQDTTLLKIAV